MNISNTNDLPGLERYRLTAQAISLIELLGNMQPNAGQVRTAERLVRTLGLSWEACANQHELLRELKDTRKAFASY